MKKIAVVLYGPPGSGKGTQAQMLALSHGLIHFDSGRFIEFLIKDPRFKNDPEISRQRTLFENGELCESEWVMKIVGEQIKKIATIGFGVVLSGSPRDFFEAFGDGNHTGIFSILNHEYGEHNIFVISLTVRPEVSILRNSNRKLCTVCGQQIIYNKDYSFAQCPFCAGKLYTRVFDNAGKIKIRLEEFKKKTEPILDELSRRERVFCSVDGEKLPYEVHSEILKCLD